MSLMSLTSLADQWMKLKNHPALLFLLAVFLLSFPNWFTEELHKFMPERETVRSKGKTRRRENGICPRQHCDLSFVVSAPAGIHRTTQTGEKLRLTSSCPARADAGMMCRN